MNDTATAITPAATSDEPIVPAIASALATDDDFANEELGERQPGTCSLDGECDTCQ